MKKAYTNYIYFLCSLLFLSNALAFDLDTKGTDFWLTFPPNFHENKNSTFDYLRLGDSLFIFITSDSICDGNIEYTDLTGNVYNQKFSITDPAKIYTFKLCYLDYELLGYNDNGQLNGRNYCEIVKKQYFHISSDNEITVYAHSQGNMSSDACLVLPGDILGQDYFVMSYKSDGVLSINNGNLTGSSTPSQFVILGTEDNTSVTIIPQTETQYNGINTQTIILNKGDSYLVQAKIELNKLNNDLTGTQIYSDKPVAVFAGHQRANIPIVTINTPSRDFLFEQMPPIETWGRNALLVPYIQPNNITQYGSDLFRILSAYNNNDIKINGVFIVRLNQGEYYEGQLVQPAYIEASSPMLVAQFKKTSDYGAGTIIGDPFEMLIPPVEQFMNDYRIINIQAYEFERERFGQPIFQKVYTQQYITVVVPNSVINNVLLDGNIITANNFTGIPASAYSFANISVSDGVHTISSNEKIAVYVYGYGKANSYGYVGGMYLRSINYQPPMIAGADSCTSFIGMVYDSSVADSKIKKVISPIESQKNVNVSIDNFLPYQKTVRFKASLIDNLKDGEFDIEATDSTDLINRQKFTIRGFTIDFPDLSSNNLSIEFDSTTLGNCTIDSIRIKNTGVLPFTLDHNTYLKNSIIFTVPVSQLPLIIQPGETQILKLSYCPHQVDKLKHTDTLYMVYNCVELKVILRGIAKPAIEDAISACNIPLKLSIIKLPQTNFLEQSYPNPASDNSIIRFGNSESGMVSLKVFDLYGNLRLNVFSEELNPGIYEVQINNDNLEQGIYFYTLYTEKSILSKTMIISK